MVESSRRVLEPDILEPLGNICIVGPADNSGGGDYQNKMSKKPFLFEQKPSQKQFDNFFSLKRKNIWKLNNLEIKVVKYSAVTE